MSDKLLFVVTEDWYFVSHRLSIARAARAAGYQVTVATRAGRCAQQIEDAGLKLIPLQHLRRRSYNPLTELRAILELIRIYRSERPNIVHHVALKPVLYGMLAARLIGVSAVNALGGLGFVFSSDSTRARGLRPVIRMLLRLLVNGRRSVMILQNPDDRLALTKHGVMRAERIRVIRGMGADTSKFVPRPVPTGPPLVVLASRMLWDKGVGDFVAMAKQLRAAGVVARFALVGDTDSDNPSAVPLAQLQAWNQAGVVEWWGRRADMEKVFADASVVCLPTTYGEGVPKVLIEAAACGRPIVAYDVPGCREIVRQNQNGLLVAPRSLVGLAAAVRSLLDIPELAKSMGARGSKIVEEEFTERLVIDQTLAVYRDLLSPT